MTETGHPCNTKDSPTTKRVAHYLRRKGLNPRTTGVEQLHGDASNRCYIRITSPNGGTFVLAVHPEPFVTDTLQEITIGALLKQIEIPIPKVIEQAGDLGIVALEDLGDQTLQDWLTKHGSDSILLYREAVDLIAKLQRDSRKLYTEGSPPFNQAFDTTKLTWELEFFLAEFLQTYRNATLTAEAVEALRQEFSAITEELAAEPRVLCHRDYHSRNLMIHLGRLVVIDFQDARMGPVTYDLVSLLRDCYVDLSPSIVAAMKERFLETLPTKHATDFERRFDLMSVQRHLKALGTFGYQIAVAGRPEFAAHVPRTLEYLRRTLYVYPRFGRLLELLVPRINELKQ